MAAVARDSEGILIGGKLGAEHADSAKFLEAKAILLGVQPVIENN